MITADRIIKLYNMKLLPGEGGYYCETYRSNEIIEKDALPSRYDGDKPFATAIYYLLTPDTKSNLHRLKTDEVYHFYMGGPVMMVQLRPDSTTKMLFLGNDLKAGQFVQVTAPAGVWQGAYLLEGSSFAFMGVTAAPGFDFTDYKAGEQDKLIEQYPQHKDLIVKLTS